MADLVVIVPSRGRPHTVAEMAQSFERTCTADTRLWFAVDDDDPAVEEYHSAAPQGVHVVASDNRSMVDALNRAALFLIGDDPKRRRGLGFMGDDHRPRTKGWDRAYLDALAARPGIVYGNDLFQSERLPTQCAMSTQVVRALGHMAPPALTHLYVDNYWRDLGKAADCLTYLPDVIIEHLHPVAGKAAVDDGYRRVNAPAMYGRDSAAYQAYMTEHGSQDVTAVRQALAGVTA
jgi:hypothetical protein